MQDRGVTSLSENCTVTARYFPLSPALQPYFAAFYSVTVLCEPDEVISDCLLPEWAGLRFCEGKPPMTRIGSGPLEARAPFSVNGPTNQATSFAISRSRVWGLVMQPAGWAKFINASASDFVNKIVDGVGHPLFAHFASLGDRIGELGCCDVDRVKSVMEASLQEIQQRDVPNEELIIACQDALKDPNVADVAALGGRLCMTPRSLERLCRRYFGFPPKLLLRRQRFLRSITSYMLDQSQTWAEVLDPQYHDQAQFVRDFRSFMGISPREYADQPHPIFHAALNGWIASVNEPTGTHDGLGLLGRETGS